MVYTQPIIGPAFTIQAVAAPGPLRSARTRRSSRPSTRFPPGAVVVFSAGGMMETGIWGELLSTRALARGAVGAVVDGGVRDLLGMRGLGFPVFASAVHAADSYGRAEVVSYNEPIVCGGVAVRPGISSPLTLTGSS